MENQTSPRKAALIAGTSLLLMALLAGFAFGAVLNRLLVSGDPAATFRNISGSESLFRWGILAWLAILILDVVVAWALNIFLRPVNRSISQLAAWLRLIYSAFLGIALLNFVFVLAFIHPENGLSSFDPAQIHGFTLMFIESFTAIWGIGLVIFGLHLLLLGYLIVRSTFVPKQLGGLLFLAAAGYLSIHIMQILLPDFSDYQPKLEMIFSIPMILGEVALAVWLLVKGGKTSRTMTSPQN